MNDTPFRTLIREYGPTLAGTYVLGGVVTFSLYFAVLAVFGFNLFAAFDWLIVFIVAEAVLFPVYPGIEWSVPGYSLAALTVLTHRRLS